MKIEFDPAKRDLILSARGLDMARAEEIFATEILTVEDTRLDYGKTRFMTVGYLNSRMVVLVWTPQNSNRRIISLRKTNEREQTQYRPSA